MNVADLGPLEQSILRAVVHAELFGRALDAASIWRSLPRYETSLANVEAALAEGSALRGWVFESGGLYACLDRDALPHGMAGARRRAAGRWDRVSPYLRGIGKLPYVESVAVVGPLAWGSLDDITRPLELAVIAEPGRVALARVALAGWRRARGEIGDLIRIAAIFDEADLAIADDGPAAALAAVALSPVVDAAGWQAWRDANPWLRARFPNWLQGALELPDHALSDRRDGRLASLRRRVSRRITPVARAERLLEGKVPGREPGLASVAPCDLAERFEERWKELESWDVAEPAIPEPPRRAAAPEPEPAEPEVAEPEPAEPEPAEPEPAEPEPAEPEPAEREPSSTVVRASRRDRSSRRRPRRSRRSAASSASARRGRRQ